MTIAGALLVLMAPAVPAIAQDDQPVDMATAYKALQAAVEQSDWQGAYAQARCVMQAADQAGWDKLTADQMYMLAIASYYAMGMAFDAALGKEPGLDGERKDFAQKMADMVFQRQSIYVISHGEEFAIEDYLMPGKITVFDFTSKYCGPCQRLAPILEGLANGRADLVLVQVDINRPEVQGIDWGSPVAQQYKLRSIPYLRVYDPEGNMVADGDAARQILMQWADQLGQE